MKIEILKNILLIWFVADAILLCTNKKYRTERIKWLGSDKMSFKKETLFKTLLETVLSNQREINFLTCRIGDLNEKISKLENKLSSTEKYKK